MRYTLVLSLLVLISGCAGHSVGASGPQPFPIVPPSGATLTLEPGVYNCPTSLPSGTHIIGHGAIVPQELLQDDFAPIANRVPVPEVRIVCPSGLTLKNVNDIEISGVIFDFEEGGGLVLDAVTYSKFEMALAHSITALTLTTNDGNTFSDTFPRLTIYDTQTGILMKGVNSKAVTWNDFGHVDIVRASNMGIDISQFSDTNTFAAVRIRLSAGAAAGVVFNDNNVFGDVDASGNTFLALGCDADNAADYTGYCADFRGDTVGNKVTMGFGIMPDAGKLHYSNSFSQTSNTVLKLQEHPKM